MFAFAVGWSDLFFLRRKTFALFSEKRIRQRSCRHFSESPSDQRTRKKVTRTICLKRWRKKWQNKYCFGFKNATAKINNWTFFWRFPFANKRDKKLYKWQLDMICMTCKSHLIKVSLQQKHKKEVIQVWPFVKVCFQTKLYFKKLSYPSRLWLVLQRFLCVLHKYITTKFLTKVVDWKNWSSPNICQFTWVAVWT